MNNTIRKLLFCITLLLLQSKANSQTNSVDSSQFNNQLDIKDIVHKIFKTKSKQNEEKKGYQFSAYPAAGYSSNTSFAFLGGANVLFTVKGATKESNIVTNFTYTLYNQTIFPLQASIWTKNDKFNIILDNRYINYPSSAYGLPGRSKSDSEYSINFKWIKLHASRFGKSCQ